MQKPYKFNGLFDTLANIGLQIFGATQSGGQSGGASGQARGLAAIRAAGNQVIAAFDSLLVSYAALSIPERRATQNEALAQGESLLSALSNPQYFYQPRSGNDKAELDGFKRTAELKLNQLRGFVQEAQTGIIQGTTPNNTTPTTPNNTNTQPQIVTNPDGTQQIIYVQDGAKDNTLLYAGLAVVALLLLKK